MAIIRKSISIDENVAQLINDYKKSTITEFSSKLSEIVKSHFKMLEREELRLKNYFTENEWKLIYDACNGTIFSNNIQFKAQLYYNVADAIELYNYNIKWDVNKNEILNKIQNLSEFECYAITILVEKFFYQES